MRQVLILSAIAALALATSSSALGGRFTARVAGSQQVELWSGVGYAALWDRGSVLGNVRRGSIRVVNRPGGGTPKGVVRGCEVRRGTLSGTLYCRGRDLRFWIYGFTWKVQLRGRGINVSGKFRGWLALEKAASGGRGGYRIGDREGSWPADFKLFRVRG